MAVTLLPCRRSCSSLAAACQPLLWLVQPCGPALCRPLPQRQGPAPWLHASLHVPPRNRPGGIWPPLDGSEPSRGPHRPCTHTSHKIVNAVNEPGLLCKPSCMKPTAVPPCPSWVLHHFFTHPRALVAHVMASPYSASRWAHAARLTRQATLMAAPVTACASLSIFSVCSTHLMPFRYFCLARA